MITKYKIDQKIIVNNGDFKFIGVISMITITRKGIRYRAYGTKWWNEGTTISNTQNDYWENEISGSAY